MAVSQNLYRAVQQAKATQKLQARSDEIEGKDKLTQMLSAIEKAQEMAEELKQLDPSFAITARDLDKVWGRTHRIYRKVR